MAAADERSLDPHTGTGDPRVGPYPEHAALAAGDLPAEAARLAALADQEAWAVGWNEWTDMHRKLNTYRNGIHDDPVKDLDGYVAFPDDRPFQVWEGEPPQPLPGRPSPAPAPPAPG